MECIRVQMGQTEAQRGHTAQLVDFCYLLYNTPDICGISMPDITSPGTWFTVCLKVMEDLQNPVHGAQGALKASCRAAGTNTGTTGDARPGFNPTTTR